MSLNPLNNMSSSYALSELSLLLEYNAMQDFVASKVAPMEDIIRSIRRQHLGGNQQTIVSQVCS